MDHSVPIMLIATSDSDSRRILGDELRRRYGADYEVVACEGHAHGRAVLEGLVALPDLLRAETLRAASVVQEERATS